MTKLGYSLSSEELGPATLVRNAQRAEEAGFAFALISDHYHPWTDAQGQSPFVWSVIGAIAQATDRLVLGTGVTCPTVRMHPALVAQAAATSAAMMPGRFFLGVGTGEALNEHITGEPWPAIETRLEMLEEAITVIRELWRGDEVTFYGDFFTVENARVYTLPEAPPPIMFAAGGATSAELAGRIGDGLISTSPDKDVVQTFEENGGRGKPCMGHLTCAYADSEEDGVRIAMENWPNAGLPGQLGQELPRPAHFEQAAELVREDDLRSKIICGPDSRRHIDAIEEFAAAGFDHVYVHQVGKEQEPFFHFYEQEVMPQLSLEPASAGVAS